MLECTLRVRITHIYEQMHLLKGSISGVLVLISLLWLTIQQVFLPNEFVKHLFIESAENEVVDFLQLKRDWCRIRSKTISWREMIEPCQQKMAVMENPRYATNPYLSQVAQIITRPAGEHTRIRIDTYTNHGTLKTFGGDSIRVYLKGVDNIAATIFDLKNGSYEALVMVMTPGKYGIRVVLDYTLCNGFNEPPTEWYVKAHCSGKKNETIIPSHISSQVTDYINVEISPGIIVTIQPSRYNLRDLKLLTINNDCGYSCDKLWDGHGVWNAYSGWKPYVYNSIKSNSLTNQKKQKKHRNHSNLWIYGDSISYYFHKRLENTDLCSRIFKQCKNTYNWIYPKALYELRHFCEDVDVNITKLRTYFRAILTNELMDKRSVLLFNLGAHFVKNTSFRTYREIIDAFIEELKRYRGEVIWKSTTAIHDQNVKVMGSFRRYITAQRVLLFNAYANAAICQAGIKLLDVYPMTASYPYGTKDGVHYHGNVTTSVETMLYDEFTF